MLFVLLDPSLTKRNSITSLNCILLGFQQFLYPFSHPRIFIRIYFKTFIGQYYVYTEVHVISNSVNEVRNTVARVIKGVPDSTFKAATQFLKTVLIPDGYRFFFWSAYHPFNSVFIAPTLINEATQTASHLLHRGLISISPNRNTETVHM